MNNDKEMNKEIQTGEGEEYNINEVIRLRGDIYAFLSRAYRKEVDESFLQEIEKIVPAFEKLASRVEDEALSKGAECLKHFMDSIEDKEALFEELARQFTTLLLGVGRGDEVGHASPFESVYLSPDHLIMQEQRDEVMEFYAKYGMGLSDDFKEPEDHLTAELSFISGLCKFTLNDLNNDNMKGALEKLKAQKEFMYGHLLRWVHMFCIDLRKASGNGFYKCLADLTMGYARVDFKFLDGFIEEFEEYVKEKGN